MAQRFADRIASESGGIIIYILAMSAGLGFLIYMIFGFLELRLKMQTISHFSTRLNLISSQILGAVENDVAWNATTNSPLNGGQFACLDSNSCPAGWREFTLVAADGVSLVGPSIQGIDQHGNPCANFSTVPELAKESCPFQYRIQWQPDCTGAGCKQSARIRTRLNVAPVPFLRLNSANYELNFIRGKIEGTLSGNCLAMGGTIDVDDNSKCVLPITSSFRCPPGTFLNGTDANDSLICERIPAYSQTCPTGVRTIGSDGSFICN